MLRSFTSPSSTKSRETGRGGGGGAPLGEGSDVGSPLTRFSPFHSLRTQDGDTASASDPTGESEPLLPFSTSKSKGKQSDPDLLAYNFRPAETGFGTTDVNGAQAGEISTDGRPLPDFERDAENEARLGAVGGYVEPSPTRSPSWNVNNFPPPVPAVTGDGLRVTGYPAGLGKWAFRDGLFLKIFPALAVLQWWFFNVLLLLLNKWIFQVSAIPLSCTPLPGLTAKKKP